MSDAERKERKHKKELKSLRNKMSGPNLIWFDSLSKRRQYDFLFAWKEEKFSNKLEKPVVEYRKMRGFYGPMGLSSGTPGRVKIIKYPPSLKHFIKSKRGRGKWKIKISDFRNSAINILLNSK